MTCNTVGIRENLASAGRGKRGALCSNRALNGGVGGQRRCEPAQISQSVEALAVLEAGALVEAREDFRQFGHGHFGHDRRLHAGRPHPQHGGDDEAAPVPGVFLPFVGLRVSCRREGTLVGLSARLSSSFYDPLFLVFD